MDLRRVAEWTGVPVDDIRALNPELRRWTTPPSRDSQYELKVPAGTADVVRDRYAAAGPSEAAALQWYTVKTGDSIVTIARKFRVSRTDLAQANYLPVASQVRAGQQLVIPRAPSGTLLASREAPEEQPRTAAAKARPDAVRAAARDADDEPTRLVYRVRQGDTLFAIARRHNVSVDDIKSWNRLRIVDAGRRHPPDDPLERRGQGQPVAGPGHASRGATARRDTPPSRPSAPSRSPRWCGPSR